VRVQNRLATRLNQTLAPSLLAFAQKITNHEAAMIKSVWDQTTGQEHCEGVTCLIERQQHKRSIVAVSPTVQASIFRHSYRVRNIILYSGICTLYILNIVLYII